MPEPCTDAYDREEDPENQVGFEARIQDKPFDPTQSPAWRQGWQEADGEWSSDESIEF
jgi:hypothetical protein